MTNDKTLTVRCRAFGGRLATVRVLVSADQVVRVYDDVAGYFTTCHRLSLRAQQRIRRMAAAM